MCLWLTSTGHVYLSYFSNYLGYNGFVQYLLLNTCTYTVRFDFIAFVYLLRSGCLIPSYCLTPSTTNTKTKPVTFPLELH